MIDWTLWELLDYLRALWSEALPILWDFLAGFPHWFGIVLWPVAKIAGVGVFSFFVVLVLFGAVANGVFRARAEEQLRKFQKTVKGGKGWGV